MSDVKALDIHIKVLWAPTDRLGYEAERERALDISVIDKDAGCASAYLSDNIFFPENAPASWKGYEIGDPGLSSIYKQKGFPTRTLLSAFSRCIKCKIAVYLYVFISIISNRNLVGSIFKFFVIYL